MKRTDIKVKDIIDLIGYEDEKVVISPECERETWVTLPTDSILLNDDILNRAVDGLCVENECIQIFLVTERGKDDEN